MAITQQSIRENAERFKARIRGGSAIGSKQPVKRKTLPVISECVHRGESTRSIECPTCGGSVKVKAFACQVFGECTLAKKLDGIACCNSGGKACERFEPRKPNSVDVLILLNRGVDQSWQAMRGGEPVSRLQSLGISSAWTEGGSDLMHYLDSGVKVVINRAFAVDAATTRSLAIENPQTKFVAVCHSSQSYLMHGGGHSLQKQNDFISLAIELPNCFYATVDERNYPGLLHERCIYLPNVVSLPGVADRRRNDVPVICLASRADEIKNTPQQIIALYLLKQRGYQFRVAMVSNRSTALTAMAQQWRLPIDIIPWMQHGRWMTFLATVDIGLQCSFSESFNYVALEHLSCGIPVVGSTAIRYLPSRWQSDPERPEDIADKLAMLLSDGADRDYCRSIATNVAKECNQVFGATMRWLLDE